MFARSLFPLTTLPQVFGLTWRTILTNAQYTAFAANIKHAGLRVQGHELCYYNVFDFLGAAFPNRRIEEVPFTRNLDEINKLMDLYGQVGFVGNGVGQQATALTSASLYKGMHAVVLVDRVMQNGTPHFVVFDGDDTLRNGCMELLEAAAAAQNRTVCDLKSDEILKFGAAAGLFRLEPVEAFLNGASQSFSRRNTHTGGYLVPLQHMVPGAVLTPVTWASIGRKLTTFLFGPGVPSTPGGAAQQTSEPKNADRRAPPRAANVAAQRDKLFWAQTAKSGTGRLNISRIRLTAGLAR